MTVESWLESAIADADRRGMPELKPLLESLSRALASLREADAAFGHPALRAGDESEPAG